MSNPFVKNAAINNKISNSIMETLDLVDITEMADNHNELAKIIAEASFPMIVEFKDQFEEAYAPYLTGETYSIDEAITKVVTLTMKACNLTGELNWDKLNEEEKGQWADGSKVINDYSMEAKDNYVEAVVKTTNLITEMSMAVVQAPEASIH